MRRFATLGAVLVLALACGSSGGSDDVGTDPGPGPDVVADAAVDVPPADVPPADVPAADAPDAAEAVDAVPDVPVDIPFPARELPFEFTRPAVGEPIPAAETTAFTHQVMGTLKSVGWARWLLRISIGVDGTTGKSPFLAWYNDVDATKAGDLVTFKHSGGEHNQWIDGSMYLSTVLNGYLLTHDWELGKLAEQYCYGLSAVVKGFRWDEDDPAPYLMARSIFPMDHEFTLDEATWHDDGTRRKRVEYSASYKIEDGWNAHTFEWPHNPTWGYEWITNMRSKDDVRAIARTTAFLYYAADAPDAFVRDACGETLDIMKGFQKDIVDYAYEIRTKDPDGTARLVPEQDLGSYAWYVKLDPGNECGARISADLIAYGETKTWEKEGKTYDNGACGNGWGTVYDKFASQAHYYNYPIVWDYHMAALGLALVHGKVKLAKEQLEGMTLRMNDYLDPNTKQPGAKESGWKRDMALLLVQAASFGLPLTAAEARHVQQYFAQAATELAAWPNWDLWSQPDGEYGRGFRPSTSEAAVPPEAIGLFFEYCNSPFKNPAGATFVDCAVVADPGQWTL